MDWTIITVTNNDVILKSCLLKSPDITEASEVILQKGYSSAAAAYNDALNQAKTDIVILAHQDVYLPSGWIGALRDALNVLADSDPDWGVLGVWGDGDSGRPPGYMYWTGVDGTAGQPFDGVHEVRSLDEVILILRKSSGLRFDEKLPDFHMYGADICMEARRRGRKCYVFSGFCVHNTNVYDMLPWQFWRNYLLVRRKWKSELPISTPCIKITWSCWPMLQWNMIRAANIVLGRHKRGKRVDDPEGVYRDLTNRGLLAASSCDGAKSGSLGKL